MPAVNFLVLVENTVDFITSFLLLEFWVPLVAGWLAMFYGITTWFRGVLLFSALRGSITYFPRATGKSFWIWIACWRPLGVWLGVTFPPRSGERRCRFKFPLVPDMIFWDACCCKLLSRLLSTVSILSYKFFGTFLVFLCWDPGNFSSLKGFICGGSNFSRPFDRLSYS